MLEPQPALVGLQRGTLNPIRVPSHSRPRPVGPLYYLPIMAGAPDSSRPDQRPSSAPTEPARDAARARLVEVTELDVVIDYQQMYLYGAPAEVIDPDGQHAMRALDDARNSHRYVGVSGSVVDWLTPIQYSAQAPMCVQRLDSEPASEPATDFANWDHVVDVDLDVVSGRLYFEPSGGGFDPVSCEVPPGNYRARLAGRGYDYRHVEGLDSYRVQLWPRDQAKPPLLQKIWPGWSALR